MKKYVIAGIIIGILLMSRKIFKAYSFDECFKIVVGEEGGFQKNPKDRGNWTSGKIGVGILKGTKYGISAMSYPTLDIENLTLAQAKEIYLRDFWNKLRFHEPAINLICFDAAVNHGLSVGNRLLDETRNMATVVQMFSYIEAERLKIYLKNPQAEEFINGWKNRLANIIKKSNEV